MKIYLCARENDLFEAWKNCADLFPDKEIVATKQDILSIPAEAVVSPANSFGNMGGGIDLLYRNYFGKKVESDLQFVINRVFGGELFVGQATTIGLDLKGTSMTFKYMIAAPTMRVPENISHTINAFLAMKAILLEATKLEIKSIVVPGLGTGTGAMSAKDCGKQVAAAIKYVYEGDLLNNSDVYAQQDYMRRFIVGEKWYKVQSME